MALSFLVLGSSSGGNASLLRCRTPDGVRNLLIDAGLGPRTVVRRLGMAGLEMPRLDAIVLTHADSDHLRSSWERTLLRDRIPVHVPTAHHRDARRHGVPADLLRTFAAPFEPVPGVRFDPFVCPHDREGSSAFRIACGGRTLGWATDLGRVPPGLLEHLRGVEALAIESNYDPGLQQRSGRPEFLVRRITGGRGHLSNRECLEAVLALEGSSPGARGLEHVVLLHLSRDCNDPELVRTLWDREAPGLKDRMVVSHPDRPTEHFELGGPGATSTDRTQGLLFA